MTTVVRHPYWDVTRPRLFHENATAGVRRTRNFIGIAFTRIAAPTALHQSDERGSGVCVWPHRQSQKKTPTLSKFESYKAANSE